MCGDGIYRLPCEIEYPDQHEFCIKGVEAREFVVRSGGTSARINVPVDWIGKRVMVVRLE